MNEISTTIKDAIIAIKTAILQSQYRAAKVVNREQLALYFGIGRYISENSRNGYWGTNAIETISEQLQKELPGLRGFGVASIKNMRQFYESWAPYFNSVAMSSCNSLTADSELQKDRVKVDLLFLPNRYPMVSEFSGFVEIGERDKADIDEREVEKAIVHNVKNFIMTFGHDFTFVGNQYRLEKYGHESFPDLLFYNRELAALVVVELKRGEFKPAYLGQLSAYLRILDSEVKKPFENPSVGIILCKQADKSFVEFLIQGYEDPMGVATYKTAEDVRKVLPTEEELRKVMDEEL